MLSDEHMIRASVMLLSQFGETVGGLFPPMGVEYGGKIPNPNYYPSRTDPTCMPWVQIMNTGSLHWVTVIFLNSK